MISMTCVPNTPTSCKNSHHSKNVSTVWRQSNVMLKEMRQRPPPIRAQVPVLRTVVERLQLRDVNAVPIARLIRAERRLKNIQLSGVDIARLYRQHLRPMFPPTLLSKGRGIYFRDSLHHLQSLFSSVDDALGEPLPLAITPSPWATSQGTLEPHNEAPPEPSSSSSRGLRAYINLVPLDQLIHGYTPESDNGQPPAIKEEIQIAENQESARPRSPSPPYGRVTPAAQAIVSPSLTASGRPRRACSRDMTGIYSLMVGKEPLKRKKKSSRCARPKKAARISDDILSFI
ncbi:hypothetical protein QR680_006938 [Steinernema hermaphroditum]|uniref:Uncharacterized protein n=1 Tax=Steinernema hermaphroditum TaxID=289476 RepID=A0AA39LY77_9BILA|nr:hypothetical protein QR680_006938 [Steinernema hermaphroditum]